MVINIGELWDTPVPIAEEKLLLPSIYSDIDCTESDRTPFRSYSRETYQSHESYDATDCGYFKSLSPEECRQGDTDVQRNGIRIFDEKNGKEISPSEQPKTCSADGGAFTQGVSTDSEGEKSDLGVDIKVNGRSGQSMCPHASKALRVRSSAAKDRHSKVNTAKGLRDRRVRLSVSTALQFYDIQDRLGLDHPSKALDWLISKAQAAIDDLPGPSSLSTLNCSICNSISQSTSIVADVISTSEANPKFKTGCSEYSREKNDSRHNIAAEDERFRNSIKAANTRKYEDGAREYTRNEKEAKVLATGVSPVSMIRRKSRTNQPFVLDASSMVKCNSPLQRGSFSREKKTTMLDCCTQQAAQLDSFGNVIHSLVPVYSSPSSDLIVPTTGGQHHDPVLSSMILDLTDVNRKNGRSSEKCTWTRSSSSQDVENMFVEPALNSCSLVNTFNNQGVPLFTLLSADISASSSSTSSDVEYFQSFTAQRFQTGWFEE